MAEDVVNYVRSGVLYDSGGQLAEMASKLVRSEREEFYARLGWEKIDKQGSDVIMSMRPVEREKAG